MIKVGLDISSLVYKRGVSRYTSNLAHALNDRNDVELFYYGANWGQYEQLKKMTQPILKERRVDHLKLQRMPLNTLGQLWKLGLNPVKKYLPKIEVFHSWDWVQPPDRDLPLVSTIHDLAILKFPKTAHPDILSHHQASWKTLKARSAQIIAVSQATKKDIVELLGFPPHSVHVIYEALPEETRQVMNNLTEEKIEAFKQKLKLDRPFLFFVGTREPRKNLMKLIQAWKPLSKEVDLLIAGAEGWDETQKIAHKYADKLRFLGFVSDEELAVLYEEAQAFVYPSLYEGFGLPILEAYFHGTPVVTSNVSSIPEVAGNAAVLVDPHEPDSIREGIEKIMNESVTDQRKRLQQMLIRLQLFNWQQVAFDTKNVYRLARDTFM